MRGLPSNPVLSCLNLENKVSLVSLFRTKGTLGTLQLQISKVPKSSKPCAPICDRPVLTCDSSVPLWTITLEALMGAFKGCKIRLEGWKTRLSSSIPMLIGPVVMVSLSTPASNTYLEVPLLSLDSHHHRHHHPLQPSQPQLPQCQYQLLPHLIMDWVSTGL